MQNYLSESKIRDEICDVGQKMYDKGFVAANDGNISVRFKDDIIIVTPTGVSKGEMDPDSLVKMTLDGEIISGNSQPSSEVKMHIEVYKQSLDIRAVAHAHPPISTAFAVARQPLDRPIVSEAILTLGVVPVADYATPGTHEVPDSIKPFVKGYNAVLLANHGLLTWGNELMQAFFRMESAEQYAKIMFYLGKINEPQELNCANVAELVKQRENMGVATGGSHPCEVGTNNNTFDSLKTESEVEELINEIAKRVLEELNKI